jgi:hypothetical protein
MGGLFLSGGAPLFLIHSSIYLTGSLQIPKMKFVCHEIEKKTCDLSVDKKLYAEFRKVYV